MEQLNLNLLRSLRVLLEQRNVTHAAEYLHLTQSAMSRQLAQLRNHFEDELLIREGNEYLLTDMAQRLKPKVQTIISQISDLSNETLFDPLHCKRQFSFASTDYVANFIFPDVMKVLHRQAPRIDVSYRIWQPEWLNNLGTLPVDFATTMATEVPENLYGIHLGEDNPVLLMADSHPLVHVSQPDLEQILNYPFIRITSGGDKDSFFDNYLRRLNLTRRVAYEVPFFISAFNVCAQSDMLLVVPRHIAINAQQTHAVHWHEINMSDLPVNSYYLFWHSIHNNDPAHRWVRQLIADVVHKSIFSPLAMQPNHRTHS